LDLRGNVHEVHDVDRLRVCRINAGASTYAFQTEADKSDPISSAQVSDPKTLNDFGNLQGLGPSTPNHFSDSDSDPPGSIKLLGGSLQISGGLNQRTEKAGNKNRNVNIPGSLH